MIKNSDSNKYKFDVVGIGNAIVDILAKESDLFLDTHNLPKGGMKLLNEKEANNLYSLIKPELQSSGGSAANTLAGIANLGGKAGFIGRVRNDYLGEVFTKDISSAGAIFNTQAVTSGPPTARCLILITPDAQRTMCTFLGASVLLDPDNLNLEMVKNTKILYLEGYLWDNPLAKKAFITAANTCKDSGGKVALSLSDSFCVDRHRESFIDLVDNQVDILFANETEIISLFQSSDFNSALSQARNSCEIAVLTRGEKGSTITSRGESIEIEAYKLGTLLDTTGAGDLYASGFLNAYANGEDLKKCGISGSICAGHIVTQIGPRTNINLLDLCKKYLD